MALAGKTALWQLWEWKWRDLTVPEYAVMVEPLDSYFQIQSTNGIMKADLIMDGTNTLVSFMTKTETTSLSACLNNNLHLTDIH